MSISSESFLQTDPVLAALNEAVGEIQERGPRRWSFPAGPEESIEVTARIDQEWVLMDTPLTVCEGAQWTQTKRLWNLLQANAGLWGGAKFAVAGTPRAVRLRAEVPIDEDIDLAARIKNARLGIQAALARFRRKKSGRSAGKPEPLHPAIPGSSDATLQALCTEAGWDLSERPDGVIAVRLEVEESFYQATVTRDNGGWISVWVELGNQDSWPGESWKALGVFLLQACGHLKTVRAAARHLDSGAVTAGFEVVLDPPANSEELGRAFRALSVACNLVRKEVKILREEVVGKEYLAMVRGWSSRSGRADTNQAPSGANKRGKT
jgi:hypothetical protein